MLLGILALSFNLALATDYCKLCENGTHTMCQFKVNNIFFSSPIGAHVKKNVMCLSLFRKDQQRVV